MRVSLLDAPAFIKQNGWLPVTSSLIKESSTDTFHPDGLFSEKIFGEVTSTSRMTTFGYVDLNTTVLHPKIFKNLVRIKKFYAEVMSGKSNAVFSETTGTLERAEIGDVGSSTGFAFFIKCLPKLRFEKVESLARDERVKVIEKFHDLLTSKVWLVMPAGARDYKIDASGKGSSEEINKLYTSLMAYSRAIDPRNGNDPAYDIIRYAIQRKCCEIYDYIENIMVGKGGGKRGFLQKKFGSRNIVLGARNVISAASMKAESTDDPRFHSVLATKLPLVVANVAFQPVVSYHLRHMFFNQVITRDNEQIAVIDQKTMKSTFVSITDKEKDLFTTSEGITKLINLFKDKHFRSKPVTVKDTDDNRYYMYLVYEDGQNLFITTSPTAFENDYILQFGTSPDLTKLRPLTYVEMFYMATFMATKDKFISITRYPAGELGNTYPSKVHLMSTSPSKLMMLTQLNDVTNPLTLPEYPVPGEEFVDSTILHPSRITNLGADYDGDMVSNIGIMNKSSLEECENYVHSKAYILDSNGRFSATIAGNVHLSKLVMFNLSYLSDEKK